MSEEAAVVDRIGFQVRLKVWSGEEKRRWQHYVKPERSHERLREASRVARLETGGCLHHLVSVVFDPPRARQLLKQEWVIQYKRYLPEGPDLPKFIFGMYVEIGQEKEYA